MVLSELTKQLAKELATELNCSPEEAVERALNFVAIALEELKYNDNSIEIFRDEDGGISIATVSILGVNAMQEPCEFGPS